jgi:RNA polymerase sigma factor (sigma-70 family)
MDDRRLAAALDARDPRGLSVVYDRYADPLYAYCWMLLRDHDAAADALHDTFLIAVERISSLEDADRLRSWLYAIARSECHRMQHEPRSDEDQSASASPDGDAASADDVDERLNAEDTADLGEDLFSPRPRLLARQAAATLSRRNREILELSARHKLSDHELASVLDVSVRRAQIWSLRARAAFERALPLAPLAVPTAGGPGCDELADLLRADEQESTVASRRAIRQHVHTCVTCTARRRREMDPAVLLRTLPTATAPAGLRAKVLADALDPGQAPLRAELVEQSHRYQQDGFPRQPASRRGLLLPAAAALVAFLGGTGYGIYALQHDAPEHHAATAVHAPAPLPVATPSASPSPSASAMPSFGPFRPNRTTPSMTPAAARSSLPPKPSPTSTPTILMPRLYAVPGTVRIAPMVNSASFSLISTGASVSWHVASVTADLSVDKQSGTSSLGAPSTLSVTVARPANGAGTGTITIGYTVGASTGTLEVGVAWSGPVGNGTPAS